MKFTKQKESRDNNFFSRIIEVIVAQCLTCRYLNSSKEISIINFVISMPFIATSGNRDFSAVISIIRARTKLLTFRQREALHTQLHEPRFIKSRGMRMKSRARGKGRRLRRPIASAGREINFETP